MWIFNFECLFKKINVSNHYETSDADRIKGFEYFDKKKKSNFLIEKTFNGVAKKNIQTVLPKTEYFFTEALLGIVQLKK